MMEAQDRTATQQDTKVVAAVVQKKKKVGKFGVFFKGLANRINVGLRKRELRKDNKFLFDFFLRN